MARPRDTARQLQLSGLAEHAPQRYENYNMTEGIIPKDTIIKPPRGISKRSKDLWNTLVPDLLSMRVLSETDFGELERLILLYDELQKIEAMIKECDRHQDVTNDKWIIRRAKLNSMLNSTQSSFTKLCSNFGMHPVDRTRLPMNQEDSHFKEEDPLEVLLGG